MLRKLSLFAVFSLALAQGAWGALPQKAAIIIYPQSRLATQYARIAQARLEQVLTDNGITVLDQKKAAELKKGWKKLEDPGALITAEEFVKNAGKYDIEGVYRVYLDASLTNGVAGIFTATALADIRFLAEDAKITSAAPSPMGSRGMPPSDGLTDSAAISNAIQRAVDLSAQQLGVKVLDFTNPRLFSIQLKAADGTANIVAENIPARISDSDPAVKMAGLANGDWSSEEVTCGRKSPDGNMALVGGYVRTFPQRQYFSRLHVVDIAAGKEVLKINTTTGGADAHGSSKLLDCLFLGNWRYIAAITGSKLFLWDAERGAEMNSVFLDEGIDNAELIYGKAGKEGYLTIKKNGQNYRTFQIVRE
jgi:hypothetical protein